MNVNLFIPCFVDQMAPHVGRAVVAVLERRVHIFELGSMRLLHSLSTPRNPHGADFICAVFGCMVIY